MRDTPISSTVTPSFPGELLIWLSASFPVGGFAYSQGLETASELGWVTDRESLNDWLTALIHHGSIRNDLILMALVWNASTASEQHELFELSAAMQPSAERAREALDQGRNFVAAYRVGWSPSDISRDVFAEYENITLAMAIAIASEQHRLEPASTLEAYGITCCSNLLSAAIRLGIIGQFDGQRIMAKLLPTLRSTVAFAMTATINDLGVATYGADLATALHETQRTRLFRS